MRRIAAYFDTSDNTLTVVTPGNVRLLAITTEPAKVRAVLRENGFRIVGKRTNYPYGFFFNVAR